MAIELNLNCDPLIGAQFKLFFLCLLASISATQTGHNTTHT